jgi:uncharacterized membrane protein
MTEALVVNAFLTLRVILVGGFLLALPHVTRRGLLFGTYVGEEIAGTEPARALVGSWTRGCLAIMALALLVGYSISLMGRPVTGNLTGTAILLATPFLLYVRHYTRARRLAPPDAARPAKTATASLENPSWTAELVAKATLVICLVVSLATVVYATAGYRAMPPLVPGAFDSLGGDATVHPKSIVAVLFAPTLNLIVSPFFALMAVLTAGAKRSVRGGTGGESAAAQDAFRTLVANVFSITALFICGMLSVFSVQLVRTGLGRPGSLWMALFGIAAGMILFSLASLIWILKGHGQGGALREIASGDAPLTGGLADNTRWVLGVFYIDRDDPSIMVEKRFGIGYALNYGNGIAVAIVVTFVSLLLGLMCLGVFALVP